MDHVQQHSRVQQQSRRPSGRGALGWAAFVVLVMVATAAIIAVAIRGGLSNADLSGTRPSLSEPPAPSPTPLPKPGGAPPRTEHAAL